MVSALRRHYEAYPYPARDPADEARRLITGSPSHLDELTHYVFGGRLDLTRPLRFLVAGGGTGDGTIMLAQQLAERGSPARVTYLDLSAAAQAVCRARAERRGLANIAFHQGSLLDLGGTSAPVAGPFDYIDCCGVLHHLPDPAAGLRALGSVLAPGGGIGLMVYAPFGRTGVYPLQAALRALTRDLPDPAAQVAVARRLLRQLPASNWFPRNRILGDHQDSDAGLYDLLLHSCDRPYAVPELAALAETCGFAVTALLEPLRYEPRAYVSDPQVLRRLDGLTWLERAAWAEQVSGSMAKHVAYLVRPDDLAGAVASLDGPDRYDLVPVLRDMDGPALARNLPAGGGAIKIDLGGFPVARPLPRLAAPLLDRMDGRRSLRDLHQAIDGGRVDQAAFDSQFDQLYAALNGIGKLLLRRGIDQS